MSKFNTPRMSVPCPACAEPSWHRITFENKQVRHFRCESCAAVHVCKLEGSFRSGMRPLDFADIGNPGCKDELESYHTTGAFHPTDFFQHVTFGVGYVVAILSPPTKMEVKFTDKVRVLACGPGSGALPAPARAEGRQAPKR